MPGLRKAVILAAGLGTRLVPYSKEMPKEMLPVFQRENGDTVLKPVIQVIFEQLYEAGVREFCFVVGRAKRAIEDHFTPDWDYIELLRRRGKDFQARLLEEFYRKVEESYILWANQSKPLGTGHAVYMARGFVDGDPFYAAASDNLYLGENVAARLGELWGRYARPLLTVKRVEDPRKYGVVVAEPLGERLYRAVRIVEKPREPVSHLANTSLYVFPPEIFRAIEETPLSPRGEIEITASIQLLLDRGVEFLAYEPEAPWVDAGTWDTYLAAIFYSLRLSVDRDKLEELASILSQGEAGE